MAEQRFSFLEGDRLVLIFKKDFAANFAKMVCLRLTENKLTSWPSKQMIRLTLNATNLQNAARPCKHVLS